MTAVRGMLFLHHTDVKALRTVGATQEKLSGRILGSVEVRVGEVKTEAVTFALHCKIAKKTLSLNKAGVQCTRITIHL